MEKKYNVYDLRTTPNELVTETINFTIDQCMLWIDTNGDATIYTIVEQV